MTLPDWIFTLASWTAIVAAAAIVYKQLFRLVDALLDALESHYHAIENLRTATRAIDGAVVAWSDHADALADRVDALEYEQARARSDAVAHDSQITRIERRLDRIA